MGIEEEFFLVDPETRQRAARSHQVLKAHREGHTGATAAFDQELFLHQLETRTRPAVVAADLHAQLVAARRAAGEAAEATGLAIAATGTMPTEASAESRPTRNPRYLTMLERFGEVALSGSSCGMHVHVGIDSEEEGVAVIDALTPYLSLVVALSANSPFAHGRDTGHASWRAQQWSHWPSAGPTGAFGTAAGYHRAAEELIASGAALDAGMLYFDARLATRYPTVEVRVADVCVDPADAVALAAFVRALADWAPTGAPSVAWRPELLRAARWRAARYGTSSTLLDPVTRGLRPADEILDDVLGSLATVLEAYGETDLVTAGLHRLLHNGGASRQRAAAERTGTLDGVVDDLLTRTRHSWRR